MTPDFTTLYKRWSTGTPRKEDMILDIHNDHSRGSKNIFSDEQLGLFEKIIKEIDEFYKHDSLDCDFCISGMEPKVPIFLVPYEKYMKWMVHWCNSPFVQKMREKYKAELKELKKKEYNQEEYNKRLQKLKKKYAPWICSHYPCKGGCVREWHTPLGWFDPEKYEICICLDRIIETYPDKVDTIAAKVLLHELGHALMYNPNHLSYETAFEYWAEESLANKIALKYLFAASKFLSMPDLFTHAKDMVAHQDDAYKFGLYAFEKNALDWRTLRDNKTIINEYKGNLWVDAACKETPMFLDIQKLFYDTFKDLKELYCNLVEDIRSGKTTSISIKAGKVNDVVIHVSGLIKFKKRKHTATIENILLLAEWCPDISSLKSITNLRQKFDGLQKGCDTTLVWAVLRKLYEMRGY